LPFPKIHIFTGLALLFSCIYSIEYNITILGIPVVEIELLDDPPDSVTYYTKTTGVFDLICSTNNIYGTRYSPESYAMERTTKRINQTDRKGEVSVEFNAENNELIFESTTIKVEDPPQNVFTMLSQIREKSPNEIDAQWYPLFHEGDWFRSRFLFIDTVSVEVNENHVLCDHYRFDIEKAEEFNLNFSPADYFSDHIASPDAIRQIWVESQGENRQIIKAQVAVYGITLTALVKNHSTTADR